MSCIKRELQYMRSGVERQPADKEPCGMILSKTVLSASYEQAVKGSGCLVPVVSFFIFPSPTPVEHINHPSKCTLKEMYSISGYLMNRGLNQMLETIAASIRNQKPSLCAEQVGLG